MGKRILFLLAFAFFSGAQVFGQITGGGGIIHVTGDPDGILATQAVDINEGNICYDRVNQIVYFYDPSGAVGDRWEPVSVSSFTDTDTKLTNPRVTGGNLTFDILNVITNTVTGTETVAILDIAPVQDVVGDNDITVTDNGSGVFTVDFTEALTTLTIDNDTLVYQDEDGTENRITLPTSDGSDTQVEGVDSIVVSGSGTTADPYEISINHALTTLTITNDTLFYYDEDGTTNRIVLPTSDGSDTQVQGTNGVEVTGTGTAGDPYIVELEGSDSADAGQVPYSEGDGSISWKDVIESITVDAEGRFMATLTDGSTVLISLDNAPRVTTFQGLRDEADDLNAGETGIAVAAEGNLLGLPATDTGGVEIGAIFFIKKD